MTEAEAQTALISDITGFTLDPYRFVMYAFPWGKGELAEYDGPEDWQRDTLIYIGEQLKAGKMTVMEAIQYAAASGHGIGKSALVAWIILWSLSTFEDTKGIVTANTETQLKTKTWAELAKWHRLCVTKDWFVFTATAIYSADKEHEKTWRFDMIPWSENKTEAFAGMHNKGKRVVVIFDEASAIPDSIWEVTEGALTDKDTEILWLVFGNPTRNVGRFHDCFNKLRHRWKHRQVDSREVKLTNKEQIAEWIKDYGDDSDFIRVRVKGTFPRASEQQFIPTDLIEAARGRHLRIDQYDFAAIIIGVDRAWSGNNDTTFWLRQGLMSRKLETFRKDEDDGIVAGRLAYWEDEVQADGVNIDFGYGTGLKSFSKQLGRDWVLIPFGGKPNNPMYADKGTEMWGDIKNWLKDGGAIPDNQDLITDLTNMRMTTVTRGPNMGKLIRVSKDVQKREGIDSPDDGDGLALTFARKIKNKSQKQYAALKATQDESYDILNIKKKPQRDDTYNPLSPLAQVPDIPLRKTATSWRDLHTIKEK